MGTAFASCRRERDHDPMLSGFPAYSSAYKRPWRRDRAAISSSCVSSRDKDLWPRAPSRLPLIQQDPRDRAGEAQCGAAQRAGSPQEKVETIEPRSRARPRLSTNDDGSVARRAARPRAESRRARSTERREPMPAVVFRAEEITTNRSMPASHSRPPKSQPAAWRCDAASQLRRT